MAKAFNLKPEWLTISTKCRDKEVIYIALVYFLDEEGEKYYIGKEFKVNKRFYKKFKKGRRQSDHKLSNFRIQKSS